MSKVAELKEQLHGQPENPLRPNQVAEYREEQQRLRSVVNAPSWQSGADRGTARKTAQRIDKMLDEQAPKLIDGARRDKVAKLADEVLTDVIQPAMLTRAEMRRNPAGAVDRFRKQENSKPIKQAIAVWKRAMRAIDPDNDDQDYTNVERFRPEGTRADGAATHMVDAQIAGHHAMTPLAKEKWPLGEPTAETPLAQAKRREMSPEHKAAAIKRLADARAAKAAKTAAAKVEAVPVEVAAEA